MTDNLQACISVLRTKDVRRRSEFYCGRLGFTKLWGSDDGPGLPHFAAIGRGGITLYLTEQRESEAGTSLYFHVEDIDELYAELLSRGEPIEQAPVSRPWGMKEVWLRDTDGNCLGFGQVALRSSS